ncbi:hypothetical protein [Corynebacterium pseudodiphtheriticum]|uniref:Secreted protein n=1 Tax=Corynebacterium pseudodiphtheriticum TaxID=37637 RepID=A0ABT7FV56_9CORY|nr:hypothetical protein [Corynebacterium pseudodiphtheriticum]ERJ45959.2 hypothetical protein N579_03550 [Corynebacterium pseudodiphtheriticum 090104]MDK4206790.1 hypothetical protein [Corynebacterium pseudodiphtheriticum]MDK4237884.1 hypothetical protein [Corynebacterium pseudodiphtheriticum]MDK4289866.1 hypothetical protein [Corynebacterium pseudodiphtheriticum]MDK4305914.1 hypothetical protein [Corynebacterium pseudodiphtheriticum]
MTSPRQPRLPEEIYRRRRMAGLAVLLLLVLLLVWIFSAIFGGGSEENPQSAADSAANQTATATAAREEKDGKADKAADKDADEAANDSAAKEADDIDAADDSQESDRPKKGREGAKSADERPSPYPEADEATSAAGACDLHNLQVTAHSDKAYYAGGDQPTFYMSIENPTDHDCAVNLDENPLRFEVYDLNTNHRMWADTDCYPAVITGNQEFKAGQTRHFEAVWSKTNSAPGECNHRPATPEGNYFLHAVVGDNASDALTFALRA